jgi:type III secretory pathway component EscU
MGTHTASPEIVSPLITYLGYLVTFFALLVTLSDYRIQEHRIIRNSGDNRDQSSFRRDNSQTAAFCILERSAR